PLLSFSLTRRTPRPILFPYTTLFRSEAGIVYAFYYVLTPLTDQPGIVPALAGVLAGILGYLVYRWIRVPEAAVTMAGVIGLIPGLAVYRALYSLMDSAFGVANGLPALIAALATGLGLAAGTR